MFSMEYHYTIKSNELFDKYYNIDESQNSFSEWKKPEPGEKKYILYDGISIKF